MSPCRPELRSWRAMCKLAAFCVFGRSIPPHPGPLPEEREPRRQLVSWPSALPYVVALRNFLPLPGGQGRGEGEQIARLPGEGREACAAGRHAGALSTNRRAAGEAPSPRGEGRGEGEQIAALTKCDRSGHRHTKSKRPDRRPARLTVPVPGPAELFGFRISAFLRPSDFGLRISPLDYSPTS